MSKYKNQLLIGRPARDLMESQALFEVRLRRFAAGNRIGWVAGVAWGALANVDLTAVEVSSSGCAETLVRFELFVAFLDRLAFFIFSSTEFANICVWRNPL